MNGDSQFPAPTPEAHHSVPTDNPPSLAEPSPSRPMIQTVDTPQAPAASVSPEPATGGFYRPASDPTGLPEYTGTTDTPAAAADSKSIPTGESVAWTASGDVLMAGADTWRFKIIILAVVAGPLILLITRSWISAVMVLLIALVFGILGSRKPEPINYRLDQHGITIGQKQYGYGEFRAFTLVTEPGIQTVSLVPLRRFSPLLSMHLDIAQSNRILDILAAHLPMESPRRDAFDQIVSKVIRIK